MHAFKSRRLAALSAGMIASTAALVAPASPASAAERHCVSLTDFTEVVTSVNPRDVGEPGMSVGDGNTATTALTAANGTPLGTSSSTSTLIYFRTSDNHAMIFLWGQDNLADGDIAVAGVFDATGTLAGETQTVPAFGLSGVYAHKAGTRVWRLVSPGNYVSTISLCG
jgi:hypothetical protein